VRGRKGRIAELLAGEGHENISRRKRSRGVTLFQRKSDKKKGTRKKKRKEFAIGKRIWRTVKVREK